MMKNVWTILLCAALLCALCDVGRDTLTLGGLDPVRLAGTVAVTAIAVTALDVAESIPEAIASFA